MKQVINYKDQLADDIGGFSLDPLGYVKYAFPWDEPGSELDAIKGPRIWQAEVLNEIGEHLRNEETRHEPLQIARSSGHGIGKSALIGMVIKWALDTCENCRIVVTANTEGQLRTKTVPEVAKWNDMAITADWFTMTTTAIYSNQPKHEKKWRCDFVPWSAENTEAFQGLHNLKKRIVLIFDEASAIDDLIWDVSEGALTDEDTEIIWLAFGNPTRALGRFRECFRKYSRTWKHKKIDSRTVEGTNKAQIQQMLETRGEDSDYFKIRVRGEFPAMSAYQFISMDDLDPAKGRHLRPEQYDFAAKIITCDPAWTGDDWLVIAMRQGLMFKILEKIPKNDNDVLIANKLARYQKDLQADAVFIDGGFGTGIYSAGKTMGHNWRIVWFNEASIRSDCVNKRAEMYVNARDWLKEGGAIPDDDELYEEAQAVTTMPMLDGKYKFPPKDKIKETLGRSPNCWDALVLSFAYPVNKTTRHQAATILDDSSYDPYA